ncbi:MAG: hypothetical protein GY757_43965 [bacterium]|nr:hypothetical protein [bacterium]
MFGLAKKELTGHDFWVFNFAKLISNFGYKFLGKVIVENPAGDLMRKLELGKNAFLYTGLHKSLWETTGILSCIHYQKLPIPNIGMGDNLVKGKFFPRLTSRVGVFWVKRPTNRREIIESSQKLKAHITHYLAQGIDTCIFPEGTRKNIPEKGVYGNFFPTSFDAVLEYEKNKEKILEEYKELESQETYIVPFNVDYSKIREDHELINVGSKPLTLHILDSLKMLAHLGNIYVSFGEPVKTADHLDKNRKELAVYIRGKCLDLVKILPINVVSLAIAKTLETGKTGTPDILENIKKSIALLEPYKDRFRGFDMDVDPQWLLNKIKKKHHNFRNPEELLLPIYRLYANYIAHYLDENK